MARRLLTNSKISFPNPYVLRLDLPPGVVDFTTPYLRDVLKNIRRFVTGSWGYSLPEYAFMDNDIRCRYYVCFDNMDDVLQFKLSVNISHIRVYMWPKNIKFTISEIC